MAAGVIRAGVRVSETTPLRVVREMTGPEKRHRNSFAGHDLLFMEIDRLHAQRVLVRQPIVIDCIGVDGDGGSRAKSKTTSWRA